jgi:hypothetical protein
MEGYCWPLSVAPGEPIRFFASTTASTYSVARTITPRGLIGWKRDSSWEMHL